MTAFDDLREARDLLLRHRHDHDAALTAFDFPKFDGPFSWSHDWFDRIADGNDAPGLIIVQEGGAATVVSFDELRRRSNRVAAFLKHHGVKRGSGVLLMLDNQVELWETMLAVMKLGAVILPTTTALGPADLQDRIERSGASFLLCNAADTERLQSLTGEITGISVGTAPGWIDYAEADAMPDDALPHPGTTADETLLLYFTSGTTSRPKLVEHTQVSYPVGHLSSMYWLGVQPGDVHLNISSPGWAKHAYSSFFMPWLAEATAMVFNYARFDAAAFLQTMRQYNAATFCAPPTVWRMLIQADLGDRPPALREVVSAGEPLNPEVITKVQDTWGITIRDGYGQTETTLSIGNTPGLKVKPGSMGRPMPGMPVVLADPVTGDVIDAPGEGEICLDLSRRPVGLMARYRDEERNAEAMAGGTYHSGDVASVDSEGYVTFIGRTDDVFKASDYKISPFELESVLIEHPAVVEAAVVPAPDDVRLAIPKAYVALATGYPPTRETAKDILDFAREHLAPWQRIRRIEFVDLPKTISGKIRRVELRTREQDHAGTVIDTEWREGEL